MTDVAAAPDAATDEPGKLPVIVLAGERPGGNALARSHQRTSALCVSLAGRPVLDWTLEALSRSHCQPLHLVGPRAEVLAENAEFAPWVARADVTWHAPASGPAASAGAVAAAVAQFPALLTAADHALLQPHWVDDFCVRAARQAADIGADVVIGLVPHALVAARFPGSRRTVLRFADGAMCGSNLFYLATPQALAALRFWQRLEALRKSPLKMAGVLGFGVALRYLCRRLTLAALLTLLSQRSGCRVSAVALDEPCLAVDVDSEADLALAAELLGGE